MHANAFKLLWQYHGLSGPFKYRKPRIGESIMISDKTFNIHPLHLQLLWQYYSNTDYRWSLFQPITTNWPFNWRWSVSWNNFFGINLFVMDVANSSKNQLSICGISIMPNHKSILAAKDPAGQSDDDTLSAMVNRFWEIVFRIRVSRWSLFLKKTQSWTLIIQTFYESISIWATWLL